MYEHTSLATARAGSDYDAARLMVIDDSFLSLGEHSEELLILGWRYIALYLSLSVALEILGDEAVIIHLEVILHIL